MTIPLTSFEGFLKQIDHSSIRERERVALKAAFPQFWLEGELVPNEDSILQLAKEKLGINYYSEIGDRALPRMQKVPNRRFSGGFDLPRQRYYTLSSDEVGNDNLTLMAELRAYRSPQRGSPCAVVDTCFSAGKAFSQTTRIAAKQSLLIAFFEQPPVFWERLTGGVAEDFADEDPMVLLSDVVAIPYRVTATSIDGVLDLRCLDAQRWLFQQIMQEGKVFCPPVFDDEPDISFPDLLPFLMTIETGGGGFTEGVGRFLRQHKIAALIYPSARNDSCADQIYGRTDRWLGWCLVDYRDSDQQVNHLIDLSVQTPLPIGGPVWCQKSVGGTEDGSWQVGGVRQLYRYRYCKELGSVYGPKLSRQMRDALLQIEGGADQFKEYLALYAEYLAENVTFS